MHIEINFPYAVKELFWRPAHRRLKELREAAFDIYGTKADAAAYICRPHPLAEHNSLLSLSAQSPQGHAKAIILTLQLKYGVYV